MKQFKVESYLSTSAKVTVDRLEKREYHGRYRRDVEVVCESDHTRKTPFK